MLVVLVVKDGVPWLRQCLLGLSRQTHPRINVLAVDNGSSDASVELLESALGQPRVLRLPANVEFSAAVGEALKSDVAKQADFVLLLHDDTVLAPDAVACMVEAAQTIDGVGVVGPKVMDWDQPGVLRDIGQSSDRFGYPYSPLEEGEIDQGQYDRIREVLFVSSCAMLISGPTWRRIGPPDDRLSSDHEDLDFCWRARLAGYRVLMAPQALARHREATLRGERDGLPARGRFHYHRERGALASLLKNYGLLSLLWILPAYLVQGLIRLSFLALTRRFEAALQVLAAWGWNLVHLPGTVRRRVRTQAVRAVPDRSVRRAMAPAWIRLRRFAVLAGQAIFPEGAAPDTQALSVPVRLTRFTLRHPAATAMVLGLFLAVVAYRHLLVAAPLTGGGMAAFPDSPSGFFRELVSGLRHTGLGGTAAASPALGLLGMGSVLALGSPPLLQKVLLLGLPAVAALGSYRAARSVTGATVPSVVVATCYALSGVVLWGLSQGRISALVFLAGLPWLSEKVRLGFDGTSARLTLAWLAGAGLGLGVLFSFFPATVLALAVLLASCLLVPTRPGGRTRGVALTAGGLAVAALLTLPLTIGLLGAGGLGLADRAGDPTFGSLARLSLADGPGDWPTGFFLPAAAALALLFVSGREARLAARAAVSVIASIYLAWLAAAGYLPLALSNPVAYLGVAALGYSLLVGLGLTALGRGVTRQAFGPRHVGAGLIGVILVGGLLAQGLQAASGSWSVGGSGRIPAAYPVVVPTTGAQYRILWLGNAAGDAFPAPGGLPDGTAAAGAASVRFAVTGPDGASALDTGRAPAGPAYRELRRALTEILAGSSRHGGALLAPFGIRFVVADPLDLPRPTFQVLVRQFDLDLVPAEGLRIFSNPKAAPPAWVSTDPLWMRAARSRVRKPIVELNSSPGRPLRQSRNGEGYTSAGTRTTALIGLSQQFDSRWKLIPDQRGSSRESSRSPVPAFGWATGFQIGPHPSGFEVRFEGQGLRSLQVAVLAILWLCALWITRRPVRAG
ncbi:MAG: glycosyltransferase [Actinomycetota bacterium]